MEVLLRVDSLALQLTVATRNEGIDTRTKTRAMRVDSLALQLTVTTRNESIIIY